MTIDDIRPQEDIPTLMIKNAADPNDLVLSSPWRHKTRTGQTIYVEMSSHPVVFYGKNSKLVIVNDVTERKLLDEKQQRLHASIQQSAAEWRQTFNAMDFPVLIVDLSGTIKRSNLAAEQIAGFAAEELSGRKVGELGDNQPWKRAAALIENVRDNPAPVAEEVKDEDIQKFDMDLDKKEEVHEDFTKDDPKPNNSIWHYDDEADTPAFLRRRKKDDE
jgi:PAS domain-containing protein